MKKTLLTLATIVATFGASFAQEAIAPTKLRKVSTPVVHELENSLMKNHYSVSKSSATSSPSTASVKDTVNYYFNKYFFMTPANAVSYPRATYVTMGGQLKDDNIYASTNRYVNSHPISINTAGTRLFKLNNADPDVTVTYSLCNLSASGSPIFPAVAVSNAVVTSTASSVVYAEFNPPVTFTANFAIVVSIIDGASNTDSLGILLTRAASIPTNTVGVTSWTCTPYDFYESNCLIKYGNGNGGASTTYTANYQTRFGESSADNLGLGKYQYDFRFGISADIAANYTVSAISSSCAPSSYTVSNISTNIFGNPVFNFNRFVAVYASKISPIDGSTFDATNYPYESVYEFDAGNGDAVVTTSTSATKFLPTYAAGTYTASLTGNYRTMYNGVKYSDKASLPVEVSACTGLNELNASNFVVYPNPSNGVIAIKNLTNNSTVELVNILGEVIYKGKVSGDATTLDFSSLPTANYYLKVTNAEGQSTVKKLQFN